MSAFEELWYQSVIEENSDALTCSVLVDNAFVALFPREQVLDIVKTRIKQISTGMRAVVTYGMDTRQTEELQIVQQRTEILDNQERALLKVCRDIQQIMTDTERELEKLNTKVVTSFLRKS